MPRVARSTTAGRLTLHTCTAPNCECGGRTFETAHDLRRHLSKGIKAHACTFEGCDKKFVQKGALTIHMQKHTGQKLSSCPFCDMTHHDAARVTKHMQAQHKQHLFQCRMACDKEVPCWYKGGRDLNKFFAHMRRCHQGDEYGTLMIAPVVPFDAASMLSSSSESTLSPAASSTATRSRVSLGSGSSAPSTPSSVEVELASFEAMAAWSMTLQPFAAESPSSMSLFPEIDPALLDSLWMPAFESGPQTPSLSPPIETVKYDASAQDFWGITSSFTV